MAGARDSYLTELVLPVAAEPSGRTIEAGGNGGRGQGDIFTVSPLPGYVPARSALVDELS